jgi:WD40 repeat protein/tetratricopeptide (TPR) repeat protein
MRVGGEQTLTTFRSVGYLQLPPAIEQKTHGFIGREWVFERVDEWLTAESDPCFLLVGAPGTGKSAVAGRVVAISNERILAAKNPSDARQCLAYAHFCRARDMPALNPLSFVERLSSRLASMDPEFRATLNKEKSRRITITGRADAGSVQPGATVAGVLVHVHIHNIPAQLAFDEAVAKPLLAASGKNAQYPITILVDALDESFGIGDQNLADLLHYIVSPNSPLGDRMRLLITARAQDIRILDRFGSPRLDLIADSPQDGNDLFEYSFHRLNDMIEPDRSVLAGHIATTAMGNFLYAQYVLDDLTSHPTHRRSYRATILPEDLPAIYREFLHRELAPDRANRDWRDSFRPVLSLLAVGRGDGLSLTHLVGGANQLLARNVPTSRVLDALENCAHFIQGPTPDGPFRIYHESFRDFLVTDREFRVDPGEAALGLAEHFVNEWGGNWASCDDPHVVEHAIGYLIEATRSADRRDVQTRLSRALAKAVTDPRLIEAKAARFGVDAALTDLRVAITLLDATDPTLTGTRQIIDREAQNIRSWDAENEPSTFAQHLFFRALDLGLDELAAAWQERLEAWGGPYLQVNWQIGPQESPSLLRTLSGSVSDNYTVAVTPDGGRAVAGSSGGGLTVWDIETGELLKTLRGHKHTVIAVAVTPDGRQAISGSDDKTVRVWDLETGLQVRMLTHSDEVHSVTVTPDGSCVASGTSDGVVRIWRLRTGEELATLKGHRESVRGLAVTPDGRRLLSASLDGTIKVWRLEKRELERTLNGHLDGVYRVAVTPDGHRAVSCSQDNTLKIWELSTGQVGRTLRGHWDTILGVAVTPDGQKAISSSMDKTIGIWDLESGNELRTLIGHSDSVGRVAVTPDGRHLVSASRDDTLKVWDLMSTAHHVTRSELAAVGWMKTDADGHSMELGGAAINPDGLVAISACWNGALTSWQPQSGKIIKTWQAHSGQVLACAITPDGRSAVSGSDDRTVRTWDPVTGEPQQTMRGHEAKVTTLAITPDGRHVLSGSWDRTLKRWDLDTGIELNTFKGHNKEVTAVAIAPDGAIAVSGSEDKTVRVWDLHTGENVWTLRGHRDAVGAVAVTPDGRTVVSGSDDMTVKVWDLQTGEERRTLAGHRDWVRAVAAISNRYTISGSVDGIVKWWDLETGSSRTLTLQDWIHALAVTDDGGLIVAAGKNFAFFQVAGIPFVPTSKFAAGTRPPRRSGRPPGPSSKDLEGELLPLVNSLGDLTVSLATDEALKEDLETLAAMTADMVRGDDTAAEDAASEESGAAGPGFVEMVAQISKVLGGPGGMGADLPPELAGVVAILPPGLQALFAPHVDEEPGFSEPGVAAPVTGDTADLNSEVLDDDAGMTFLKTRAGRPTDEDDDARKLSRTLGGLHFALELAAAYCSTGISFADYLERLSSPQMGRRDYSSGHFHNHALAAALGIAVEAASAVAPMARPISIMAAYLAPEDIPHTLFGVLVDDAKGPDRRRQLDEGLAAVALFGLGEHRDETLTVNPLMQAAVRDSVTSGDERSGRSAAITALDLAFPQNVRVPDEWPICRRILPHILTLKRILSNPSEEEVEPLVTLLNRACRFVLVTGTVAEGVRITEEAAEMAGRHLGANHLLTLTAKVHLARSYRAARRASEAVTIMQDVVTERERILGSDHRDTLDALNDLAACLYNAGRYSVALSVGERVAAATERLFGPDDLDTLQAWIDLAAFYEKAGRIPEALQYEERVAAKRERFLGAEHPETLNAWANLAGTYDRVGRSNEAVVIGQRVLAIRTRLLGPNHADTRIDRENLVIFRRRSKNEGNLDLLRGVVADRERVLGAEHPDTKISKDILARHGMSRDSDEADLDMWALFSGLGIEATE